MWIEKIIDTVKIEGMLHILPNDKKNLSQAIQAELLRRLPSLKQGAFTTTYIQGYNDCLKDIKQILKTL